MSNTGNEREQRSVVLNRGKRTLLPPSAQPVLILHPFLFSIYPILVMVSGNWSSIETSSIFRPMFILMVCTCMLWLIFSVLLRALHKGALVASAIGILLVPAWNMLEDLLELLQPFLGYLTFPVLVLLYFLIVILAIGYFFQKRFSVKSLLSSPQIAIPVAVILLPLVSIAIVWGGGWSIQEGVLLSAYLTAGSLIVHALVLYRGDCRRLTITANRFAMLLVALYSAHIVYDLRSTDPIRFAPLPTIRSQIPRETMPDVYLMLLEGYPRSDILLEQIGYNNLFFESAMKSAGFTIPRASRSRYSDADAAAASLLNLDYLPTHNEFVESSQAWRRACRENRLFAVVKSLGYRVVSVSSGLECWRNSQHIDTQYCLKRVPTEFEIALLTRTALGRILDGVCTWRYGDVTIWRDIPRRARTLDVFAQLSVLAGQASNVPRLICTHLSLPGFPLLFTATGELPAPLLSDQNGGLESSPRDFTAAYAEQITFTNRQLLALVRQIKTTAQRPAAILIVSLNGTPFPQTLADTAETQANMIMINLPKSPDSASDDDVPDDVSLPNMFRVTLNRLFDAGLPLLAEESSP